MAKTKTVVEYDDGSHKRYFIYRHKMMGEDQIVEYFADDQLWVSLFNSAYLFGDKSLAHTMAKSEKACFPERDVDFVVCIGSVDVVVDGYFSPEVV